MLKYIKDFLASPAKVFGTISFVGWIFLIVLVGTAVHPILSLPFLFTGWFIIEHSVERRKPSISKIEKEQNEQ